MEIKNILGLVITFLIISTIGLVTTLLFYVAVNDYVYVTIQDVAGDLKDNNIINQINYDNIVTILDRGGEWVQYVDYIFLASLTGFMVTFLTTCYFSKRLGYFSAFTLISVGLMILIFFGTYIFDISVWYEDLIMNKVIPNLEVSLTYFHLYMNNFHIFNGVLILLGIILNVVDLDVTKIFGQKDKELYNGEQ